MQLELDGQTTGRRYVDRLAASPLLSAFAMGALVFAIISYLRAFYSSPYLAYHLLPFDGWPLVAGVIAAVMTYVVIEEVWKPDLRVIARMVEALSGNGPMVKTQLYSKSGLNYTSFQRYLKWMLGHGLVEARTSEEDNTLLSLTRRGVESHEAYLAWLSKLSTT